jgi:hypothetical protein
MNYKNNTPFKLKGSPFKQTGKTDVGNGNDPDMVEDVFTKHNENKMIGNSNNDVIAVAPSVKTENVDLQTSGNSINEDGSISRSVESQKGTITSSGDKLIKGSKLPSYKQAWEQDIDGIRTGKGYGGKFENYLKDMGQIQPGDARDVKRETARKEAAKDKIVPGEKTTNLDTNQQKGQLGVYDYGTKQSSYESRKNIRTTKQAANTTKNNSIGKARLEWKAMSEKERKATGFDSKSDYMKSKKLKARIDKKDAIIKTSESEALNSQRASDQNVARGGKVRGNKRNLTSYDSAETIKGAEKSMDLALSGGINTISQQINKNKNIGKGPGFRMGGYGSKNKNK